MSSRGDPSRSVLKWILTVAPIFAPAAAAVLLILHFAGPRDHVVSFAANGEGPLAGLSNPVARTAAPTREALSSPDRRPGRKSGSKGSSPASADDTTSPIVWVRRGDSIEVRDAPGGNVVAKQGDETEFGAPSVFSVQRQKHRWLGVTTPLVANGDVGWIRADPRDLKGAYIDYSIDVDLSERSASLYRGDEEVRSWPITIGAEASPTPTGKFAVTDTFRGGLNPAYGCCALALSATQPNLPSGWLGGNRIAIHGTSGPLGLAESNGCIRSPDEDMKALIQTVPLGTPVKIHE